MFHTFFDLVTDTKLDIFYQQLDDNLDELKRQFEEATSSKLKCQHEAEVTAVTIELANRCSKNCLRKLHSVIYVLI